MIRKAAYPDKLRREDIARLAYSIFEERGRQPGHDLDDWLDAEARLLGAVAPEDDELETQPLTGINPHGTQEPAAQASRKAPLEEREHPFARDERGAASREEIRRRRVFTAPRQPSRPQTRSR